MTLASAGYMALVCHAQTIGDIPTSRLDAAGICDDVILGNQGAIERALHQQYGAVQSPAVRFERI
jgi:hypothetical protein